MGNRQTTDNRKSAKATPADAAATTQEGTDRKQQQSETAPEAEVTAGKKRRRGRGRKVTDVTSPVSTAELGGSGRPSHPELISTTTLDTGEAEGEPGSNNRRLLELTIYRSYSATGSNGSAVSRGMFAVCVSNDINATRNLLTL